MVRLTLQLTYFVTYVICYVAVLLLVLLLSLWSLMCNFWLIFVPLLIKIKVGVKYTGNDDCSVALQ